MVSNMDLWSNNTWEWNMVWRREWFLCELPQMDTIMTGVQWRGFRKLFCQFYL